MGETVFGVGEEVVGEVGDEVGEVGDLVESVGEVGADGAPEVGGVGRRVVGW